MTSNFVKYVTFGTSMRGYPLYYCRPFWRNFGIIVCKTLSRLTYVCKYLNCKSKIYAYISLVLFFASCHFCLDNLNLVLIFPPFFLVYFRFFLSFGNLPLKKLKFMMVILTIVLPSLLMKIIQPMIKRIHYTFLN